MKDHFKEYWGIYSAFVATSWLFMIYHTGYSLPFNLPKAEEGVLVLSLASVFNMAYMLSIVWKSDGEHGIKPMVTMFIVINLTGWNLFALVSMNWTILLTNIINILLLLYTGIYYWSKRYTVISVIIFCCLLLFYVWNFYQWAAYGGFYFWGNTDVEPYVERVASSIQYIPTTYNLFYIYLWKGDRETNGALPYVGFIITMIGWSFWGLYQGYEIVFYANLGICLAFLLFITLIRAPRFPGLRDVLLRNSC